MIIVYQVEKRVNPQNVNITLLLALLNSFYSKLNNMLSAFEYISALNNLFYVNNLFYG